MYNWRNLTTTQREDILRLRKQKRQPWHSPPHMEFKDLARYLVTAACFEHAHIIGQSPARMAECEAEVLRICQTFEATVFAWCVLPNHYHVLMQTSHLKDLLRKIGRFHGRSSYYWNNEDDTRGRKVWFNCFDRAMRSERHFWASLNYVHHNPVHHGYVARWQDWPFSSAAEFIRQVGREKAAEIWKKYPILDYGKKWDVM